jgi:hypothetical protein
MQLLLEDLVVVIVAANFSTAIKQRTLIFPAVENLFGRI